MRRLGLSINQIGQIGGHQQLCSRPLKCAIQQRPPSPFEGNERFVGALNRSSGDNAGHIIFIPPRTLEVERLIAQFSNELNNALAAMAAREEEATTVAAWAHYRLVALHPFHDGNGRTSRLLLVLSRAGLALLILQSESRDRYNELL
uniref:Fido domain-containing protein n=1 Tax=Globodera pallida TaxID=36090 RepID=A0A183CQT7_GLOPA